jgi:NADH-quinone oxidoreductase subunit N
MSSQWAIILPHVILAMGGFAVFCVGAFWRNRPSGTLFAIALLSALCSGAAAASAGYGEAAFLGMVDAGGYGRFFCILFSLITVVTLLFSFQYAKSRGFSGDEFYGCILFAALGMVLVSGAAHWLIFFLGLELLSLSLYVLIAARKGDARSNEAALKYFIMGSVASGFLTFGIAVIYAVTGKMNIAQSLGTQIGGLNQTGLLLGLSLLLVGIGFKVSLVPFHLWTPDVYQGAPAPVTAFLSTGSKVALISALLRFAIHTGESTWTSIMPVLWIMAVLTMIVGNVSALSQVELKRLLAYSSMAQMGYLIMTLLAVRQSGASAIVFYASVYGLMDLGAFGTVGLLSLEDADRDTIDDYRGLGYSSPWKSALLAVCLLSLAGLPPTAGFMGKFALFQAVLESKFIILAIIGISAAIISIYFYFKVIVTLYMRPPDGEATAPESDLSGNLACGAILVLILWLGITPSVLFNLISRIITSFGV